MIERVDGEGSRLSSLCRKRGLPHGSGHLVFFRKGRPYNDPVEIVLERLSAFPEFDRQSIFFTNVVDRRGRPMEALWVPVGCPKLVEPSGKEIGRFPDESETFIVLAWNRSKPDKKHKIPVIASDPGSVGRIVEERAREELRIPRDQIEFEVLEEGVSPDEFVELLKEQIDEGRRLPGFMLKFADLEEYAQRRRGE